MRKRERVANLPYSDIISRYVHLFPLPFSSSPLPPAFRSTFPPFSALFHMQNHRRRSIVVHCGIGPVHPSFISRHPPPSPFQKPPPPRLLPTSLLIPRVLFSRFRDAVSPTYTQRDSFLSFFFIFSTFARAELRLFPFFRGCRINR